MNVASLKLCKELYELSGWKGTYFNWAKFGGHLASETPIEDRWHITDVQAVADYPAYDLGYLLRKLPSNYMLMWHDFEDLTLEDGEVIKQGRAYVMSKLDGDMYEIDEDFWNADQSATPEDAACKLAIELFKQGVLPKKERTE